MRRLAEAAVEKKARDLVLVDVRGRVSYADWFLLCSGRNRRQVQAIADAICDVLKREQGTPARGVEGKDSGTWVLVDGGDVVVHVFEESQRGYYDLDGLWLDAPKITADELGLHVAVSGDEGFGHGYAPASA